MDTLLHDVRFAIRTLGRNPAFTLSALACLALGIGANTAIFSVINGVLLQPLPYPDPERLVVVFETHPGRGVERNVVSPANYLDWRSQSSTFGDMATYIDWRANVTELEEPVELPVAIATASFFSVLGVPPALGRVYTAEEDRRNAPRVLVISHALWQRQFGGRRDALGSRIQMNGNPYEIIGVMPRGFGIEGSPSELWVPMGLDPSVDYRTRTGRYLSVIGRLRPGATVAQARGEIQAIARRLESAHPVFNTGWSADVVSMTDHVVGGVRRTIVVLGGVVAFVLLIACANVANLSLARAAARSREIAVRAALGAARVRVVRQLLTESVVLAVVGGAAGVLLAVWGIESLVAIAPQGLPRLHAIRLDAWTLVFTVVLTVVTGVLFGLVPAVHAARGDLQAALKSGARGSTGTGRARAGLVVAQVALSLVLLVGAGLMIRSVIKLQGVSPGFEPHRVLTLRLQLSGERYHASGASPAFFDQLLQRVRAVPGVEAASAITWLPFAGGGSSTSFWLDGRPIPPSADEWVADVRGVDPGYFRTMRIPVLRGTPFDARANAPSPRQVVVNETFVRTHFANEDPIGRRVIMPWGDTLTGEIVGVVADTRHTALDSLPQSMIYWAMRQFPSSFMTVVVRTTGDAMAMAPVVTREVRALDPDQPVADVRPLEEYLGRSVAQRRFTMALLASFAAVALVLAAVGIYGVLAYSVAQRTREIGVRMALGAREAAVARMIVNEGMVMVAAGLALGVAGALALTRVLATLLYAVSPTDPATFTGVAVALAAVALSASYLPARRATRVDPIVALRSD